MIKECLPKVGIKLLKISYVRIATYIILCFLTFCSSDQSLLRFLNFKLLFISISIYNGKQKHFGCKKVAWPKKQQRLKGVM